MLPMLVSSAQRLPWPSCSMPSLVGLGEGAEKKLYWRGGAWNQENMQTRRKTLTANILSTNAAGEGLEINKPRPS